MTSKYFDDSDEDKNSDNEEFKGGSYIKQYYQNKYGNSFKRPQSNYEKINEQKRNVVAKEETKKLNFYGRKHSTSSSESDKGYKKR